MSTLNKANERAELCKSAGLEVFNELVLRGIHVIHHGVGATDDSTADDIEYVILITLHISEKSKKYDLPNKNGEFQILYFFRDYPSVGD